MASFSTPIDSNVVVVTPENIAFRYQAAGPFRRFPAFLLDLLIRGAILFVFGIAAGFAGFLVGPFVITAFMIGWFLVEWFYGGIFESVMNGQTPGKRVMGLRVLTVNGQPITPVQAVLRNVLRFVDMMPMLSLQIFVPSTPMYFIPTCGFYLAASALSARFQRLGDIVCGTIVVIEEPRWLTGVAKIEDPRAVQLAAYIPLDFRINRSMARALAAYVDRRRFFSPARRREVARHLAEPLLAQWGFPADTSYDLLLCALYYRAFISDRRVDDGPGGTATPFGPTSQVSPPSGIFPAAEPPANPPPLSTSEDSVS